MNDSQTKRMVLEQIMARGITSKSVIEAFLTVPRPRFVSPDDQGWAFGDHPLPIDCGQTISQPYIVALMTESVAIQKQDVVLEIGTGSGYQTAILASLSKEVYTVERHPQLQKKARLVLSDLGFSNVSFRVGNGYHGWEEHSPFDVIVVTAAAPEIPAELLAQLKTGGRMVIPVGEGFFQELILVTKQEPKNQIRFLCNCRFVAMIDSD
jgi:protein-L-isoaspartate(D-aspartate) O-methyltransferase